MKESIWGVYCDTDSQWEYTDWQQNAPTVCPVNAGHTIRNSSISAFETRNAILSASASNLVKRTATIFADINSMSITPGEGRYLAEFTAEIRRTTTPSIFLDFQVAVDGSAVTNSKRQESLSANFNVIALNSEVTVTDDAHVVSIQWKGSGLTEIEIGSRALTLTPLD